MSLTLIRAVRLAFCVLPLIAAMNLAAHAQRGLGNPYIVANISVRAEAKNAVEAKKIALEAAQSKAFRALVQRLIDFRLHARIPTIEPDQVERLVSNIDVRNEGFSGTTYRATFDVGFSDRAVKALFNRFAVPYSEERAQGVLILPVYITGGAAVASDRNPWRMSLAGLDLKNGLVPVALAPTRSDITADVAKAYFASPDAALETLRNQHRTRNLILAVAELGLDGETLTVQLLGSDDLGTIALERKFRMREASEDALADFAAGVTYQMIQQRWKLTRPASLVSAAGGLAPLTRVELVAEFSGLREWQSLRGKLQRLPGLQNFDVKSVSPRGAQISFDFPGGGEQLAQIAASQGMAVEPGARGYIIRAR